MGGVHLEIDHIPCLGSRADFSFAKYIIFPSSSSRTSSFETSSDRIENIFRKFRKFPIFDNEHQLPVRFVPLLAEFTRSNRSPCTPDLSLGGVFETGYAHRRGTRENPYRFCIRILIPRIESFPTGNAIVLLSFLLDSNFPLFLLFTFENDYP